MAEVLCSGSSRNPVVRCTPMFGREVADLDVGPHGAVVDNDAFLHGF